MKIYKISELIEVARSKSPFYRELYRNLGKNPKITELPVLESQAFWLANGVQNNQVLTAPLEEGVVFKSGGTTGSPKFSYFAKAEWQTFTEAFGEGMTRGGLIAGEKIANLFYAGDLYASFLFIMKSIEASPVPVIHFPLSGGIEIKNIIKTLKDFEIDVWAGVPTTIMKLTEEVLAERAPYPRKILFGGESFYPDQREHLQAVFPGVIIQSIGYASVDGGLLGFVEPDCKPGEHHVFSDHTIIEILDEVTNEPIEDVGRIGKVVLTNLTRVLMPIIRYPAGDLAMWVDPKDVSKYRKFKIQGRSEEAARFGPVTLYYDDLALFLQKYKAELESSGFQMVIKHFQKKDQLVIRIATSKGSHELKTKLEENLMKERHLIKESLDGAMIHPVEVCFIDASQLIFQPRTGKLRRLIDERF